MRDDRDTGGRDWLDLLPREAWPEPWASMDRAAPPPRPNDIPDPERLDDRPRMVPVLVVTDRRERERFAPYIAALEGLGGDLRDVQQVWRAKQPPEHSDRRHRANFALEAVVYFVETIFPNERDLSAPLVALMEGLTNLNSGKPVDWLEPATQSGKSKGAPIAIANLRGRLAALVTLQMDRHGDQLEQACRVVFRGLLAASKRHPVFEGAPDPYWRTIKNWRDKCIGRADDSPMADAYHEQLAGAALQPSISVKAWLKNLRKVEVS
jgi:hypothetical protein